MRRGNKHKKSGMDKERKNELSKNAEERKVSSEELQEEEEILNQYLNKESYSIVEKEWIRDENNQSFEDNIAMAIEVSNLFQIVKDIDEEIESLTEDEPIEEANLDSSPGTPPRTRSYFHLAVFMAAIVSFMIVIFNRQTVQDIIFSEPNIDNISNIINAIGTQDVPDYGFDIAMPENNNIDEYYNNGNYENAMTNLRVLLDQEDYELQTVNKFNLYIGICEMRLGNRETASKIFSRIIDNRLSTEQSSILGEPEKLYLGIIKFYEGAYRYSKQLLLDVEKGTDVKLSDGKLMSDVAKKYLHNIEVSFGN